MSLSGRARRAVVLLLAVVGAACSRAPVRYVAPEFYSLAPGQVAVLPFANESVDLVGPELLRRLVVSRLGRRGYRAVPTEAVDEGLKAAGVTDGGQLAALTPQKVGEAAGGQWLLYGTVEEFTMQNLGFVMRRSVRLRLRLVAAATGTVLWEDTGAGSSGSVALKKKEAGRAFLEGLAERMLETALRVPLMPESESAVDRLLSSMPGR